MARISYLAAFAALSALASAQAGPNTLAKYNPSLRTMSVNSTFCILPISKDAAKAIGNHEPLAIPDDILPNFPTDKHPLLVQAGYTNDILPNFPTDKHPLLVQAGYTNDIRMTALDLVPLQIPALMAGALSLPYMDVTNDGKTPITAPVNNYIGGIDGHDLQSLVPSLAAGVSPFEGTTTFPASFAPDNAAVQTLPDGSYSIEVKPFLLPNQISGPGVYAEAFDMLYTLTDESPYTERSFHALVNGPQLLNSGRCQRNTLYFNETFAQPKMAVGNVTLYHQILATPPASIEGVYSDVYCYQVNAEQVGEMSESCVSAAENLDPEVLE
ncbi:hypothetical protein BDV18DRAFT_18466 [Aspergillus unguis]